MATLALSLAGQAIGGAIGGPFGAMAGRALGALAGSAIDAQLFGSDQQAATSDRSFYLTGSSEGATVPRIYGWTRLGGNIIWATELVRLTSAGSGSKASSQSSEEDVIAANFALALCEGEVSHIGRIWADGELLETEGLNIRAYLGSETQEPDSLIVAKQGAGNTPAYRGTCYLVFEQFALTDFGNRIPQITVEICRAVGDLEPNITAITVIPGATEYGYDPNPRVRVVSPGASTGENTHVLSQTSDWTLSIDELTALCPNLKHVALVVSWFGTDLRCGECRIEPRVEGQTKNVTGAPWSVAGVARDAASEVSTHDGGPAYGGTPSDDVVLRAIADLKARGLKVTLYPLILMDIAQDNALSDPYGGAAQAPYPWRGRVTCFPAIGEVGTIDQTASAASQIADFVGSTIASDFAVSGGTVSYSGPGAFRFSRMVLHYAALGVAAGGVDAFVIGSEMRGLSFVRSSGNVFPFVNALVDLAAQVRTLVGSGTQLTYAADWSEYSGYQPNDGSGDKYFHLDPLWASANIDAIGIDNYMPIADWRDGREHLDAASHPSIYDAGYLKANIAGGEGFDWYYADDAARREQTRTPITDGAYDEPWIWRYKDLVNWWGNAHHERIGGIRSTDATAWVAEAKPVWFTELGCAAVDKGPNLPSAFPDPKSSENAAPYFSTGATDALIQRQFLRAHFSHWANASANPVSASYGANMLDLERLYLWTWDARPFPAFPNQSDVWADGDNYVAGHWLTGRLGAASPMEMLEAIAEDFGVAITDVAATGTLVDGVTIEGIVSLRDAIDLLCESQGLFMRDDPDGLGFVAPRQGTPIKLVQEELVGDALPLVKTTRAARNERLGQLGLNYLDRQRDYRQSSVTALALDGTGNRVVGSPLTLNEAGGRHAAANLLIGDNDAEDTIELTLKPDQIAFEVGDLIERDGDPAGVAVITQLRDSISRKVTARILPPERQGAVTTNTQTIIGKSVPMVVTPELVLAHLPPDPDQDGATRLLCGAFATPWPGYVSLCDGVTGAELTRLTGAASLGVLATSLNAMVGDHWHDEQDVEITLYNGHLASASKTEVLGGANRMVIQHADGAWEIIGFQTAEMTGETRYRLRSLLRGLDGTGPSQTMAPSGAKCMLINKATRFVDVPDRLLGAEYALTGFAGARDLSGLETGAEIAVENAAPLAPSHLKISRELAGEISFSWIRRSRVSGQSWALKEIPLDATPESYRVQILSEGAVLREMIAATGSASYSTADQIADFGTLPESFDVEICQISAVYGAGQALKGEFHD